MWLICSVMDRKNQRPEEAALLITGGFGMPELEEPVTQLILLPRVMQRA